MNRPAAAQDEGRSASVDPICFRKVSLANSDSDARGSTERQPTLMPGQLPITNTHAKLGRIEFWRGTGHEVVFRTIPHHRRIRINSTDHGVAVSVTLNDKVGNVMNRPLAAHGEPRTNISHLRLTVLLLFLLPIATALSAQQAINPDIEHRIDGMLAHLSLQQKLELLGGISTWYTHPEASIGLRCIRLSDGPAGLRSGIPAIAHPAPIALAATWDPKLAEEMGAALGGDARARGVDILLGPGVDIARAPMGGRNFEYMGEDPWLASRIAVSYINGVQSRGVSATIKHYALNDEEYNRHSSSSDVDERTIREINLPAFEGAVQEAHVGAIVDSYNLVDDIHATQSG